jgi:hypothetical protein
LSPNGTKSPTLGSIVLVSLDDDVDELDPAREWKYRATAIPCALALALVFNVSPVGHFLQRTFLSMIPHELGHAITAWYCGYAALPTLWKTLVPEARGVIVSFVLAAGAGSLAWFGWKNDRTWLVILALVLGVLQLAGTTAPPETASLAITFGGDAGAMIIGTGLMLCFFVPAGSKLRRGALRWGLLVIGAAAYVDVAMTWYRSRSDEDAIPFGIIEGVGLSDPAKLLEAGWEPKLIVSRYSLVAGACLAIMISVWAWQTWTMRQRARA